MFRAPIPGRVQDGEQSGSSSSLPANTAGSGLWSKLMFNKGKSKKSKESKKSKTRSKSVSAKSPVLRRVRVDRIIVRKRKFRKLKGSKVAEIAGSIREVGLMHLPTVYIKESLDGDAGNGKIYLVAGQHRLAAVKKLKWEFIDVIVVERSGEKNRKRQITENLHRSDLTKLESAKHVTEWVNLCVEEGRQLAHPQPNDKGISRTAKKLGMSPKSVRRALLVGGLNPNAQEALKAAGLDDNETVLLEVAKAKPKKQVAKVEQIVQRRKDAKTQKGKGIGSVRSTGTDKSTGTGKSTGKVKPESDDHETDHDVDAEDSADTPFDKLKKAWEESPDFQRAWAKADPDDRQRFIDEVLTPEFCPDEERDSDEW